jgi:CRP-like cAMP-binding protein
MSGLWGWWRPVSGRRLELMETVPLFAGLGRAQLTLLSAYLDEVEVEPGRTLVREGQANGAFWILVQGEVEVSIAGRRRRILGPGDFFGATSMLDGRAAVATATTRTPIRALVASPAQFLALESNETVARRLRIAALERMREYLEVTQRPPAAA